MQNLLFVFGCFSEGMFHFKKIEPYVASMRQASVRGALHRLPSGIPVLTDEGTEVIGGAIVELRPGSEILLALLDEFHGVHRADPDAGLFFRRTVSAAVEGGEETVETDCYFMNPKRLPRGAKAVHGGDWKSILSGQAPLYTRLSERQRAYIQKLGASSGREIIPIDLGLYRELMHLEIVIDKGRRLALTPLGQEVYRFMP